MNNSNAANLIESKRERYVGEEIFYFYFFLNLNDVMLLFVSKNINSVINRKFSKNNISILEVFNDSFILNN